MVKLTEEQLFACERALKGGNLGLIASPGAGKTSTLEAIAKAKEANNKGYGMVLCYNKAIQQELERRMPESVEASTIHSLAWRAMPDWFRKKAVNNPTETPASLASRYGLKNCTYLTEDKKKAQLSNVYLAKMVIESLERFAHSADEELGLAHIQTPLGMLEAHKPQFQDYLFPFVQKLMEEGYSKEGKYSISFEFLLKSWYLAGAQIDSDYLMLDEAQDSNSVTMEILKRQSSQLILTGDPNQMLYEFRGAYNFLTEESLKEINFESLRLSQTFRFGPRIADIANELAGLLGDKHPIIGLKTKDSLVHYAKNQIRSPRSIICRTNAEAIQHLADSIEKSRKTAFLGGKASLSFFVEAVSKLQSGIPVPTHPILGVFTNWDQVVEFSETPAGKEISSMIRLVNKHGAEELKAILSKTVPVTDSEVVVCTAHQSKGTEWDNVVLTNDYFFDKNEQTKETTMEASEIRLLYVAMTRAVNSLDLSKVQGNLSQLLKKTRPEINQEINYGWGLVKHVSAQGLGKEFNKANPPSVSLESRADKSFMEGSGFTLSKFAAKKSENKPTEPAKWCEGPGFAKNAKAAKLSQKEMENFNAPTSKFGFDTSRKPTLGKLLKQNEISSEASEDFLFADSDSLFEPVKKGKEDIGTPQFKSKIAQIKKAQEEMLDDLIDDDIMESPIQKKSTPTELKL